MIKKNNRKDDSLIFYRIHRSIFFKCLFVFCLFVFFVVFFFLFFVFLFFFFCLFIVCLFPFVSFFRGKEFQGQQRVNSHNEALLWLKWIIHIVHSDPMISIIQHARVSARVSPTPSLTIKGPCLVKGKTNTTSSTKMERIYLPNPSAQAK